MLWSPFLGGGSVELACAARGIRVFGSDLFEPLVNFWNHLLEDPDQLANAVEDYLPLPKPRFYELQKTYLQMFDPLERAAVFFVLNRASYSGATLAGGMSPGHPRFTPSSIQRLRDFHIEGFSVKHCDYREAIINAPDEFMYLDPPYIIESKLYGYKGDMHTDFDHEELAESCTPNRDGYCHTTIQRKFADFTTATKSSLLSGYTGWQEINALAKS